ncbi:MAG: glutamine amidotransferase [Isosphaeraceae bacterium]|nr:glutamine amidotransferase [Isosphaeraceae bacterium]
MSIGLNPIIAPVWLALFGALIVGLTIWAYARKMRTTSGAWRWVALTLRLIAVALCLLAALRPSVSIPEKKSGNAAILLMIDTSSSQQIRDEVGSRSRWEVGKQALADAKKSLEGRGPELEVHEYQFDGTLREAAVDDATKPEGRETAIGSMLLEAVKKHSGTPISAIYLISDGANNGGIAPLVAAENLKRQLVPVSTIGVGSENAGGESRDVAIRDFVVGPTVFVKNKPEIRAVLSVRGFAGVPLEVSLYAEGETEPVARKTVTATDPNAVVAVTGLEYVPTVPGEKRMTLTVKPRDGELVLANNEFTSYLNVLKGGLRVLYLQGPNFSWEPRFLIRALDAAKEINVDYKVVRRAASGDSGLLPDSDFAPGTYDVYIIGDLPADHLTAKQQRDLADLVEKGAGLMMLGGRSTFGPGGWGSSPLARVMPVNVSANDGQIEPEGGFKVVPNDRGLENYLLRLAPDRAESSRLWGNLPKIMGTNLFLGAKPNAIVLAAADTANREPLMVVMDTGRGRSAAFGGETWPWRRSIDDAGILAHLRFWRQAILWLAHKEDAGDQEVRLKLDSRRIALGQKLDFSATAEDAKKDPIPGVVFRGTITHLGPDGKPEPVNLFPQGNRATGAYFATGKPGEYRIEVIGTKDGKEVGRADSRFMVYEDDRELENPAADRSLLRQIAEITGGKSLQPEEIDDALESLDTTNTDRVSLTEYRIWDNWPFLILFTLVLTLEWWLRKSRGWV